MPFDNAPERAPSEELSLYERLKILRELVPKSGDQTSWGTCLWSVARRDERLLAAGLGRFDAGHGNGPSYDIGTFFGCDDAIFGKASRADKAGYLDRAIERAKELTPA